MFVLEKIKQYAQTDSVALINRGETLTYCGLEAASEAFSAYLLDNFGGDKTPVMIYGHKQTLFLPCMYGSLKAGRAYVPVDVTVPAKRVKNIAEVVQPKVFVNLQSGVFHNLPGTRILTADDLSKIFKNYAGRETPRTAWVHGDDDCYILFTSGSTGKPKGVPIGCANLENLAENIRSRCVTRDENAVVLNQISYSFDVSVILVYIAVSMGKTLYTIDREMVENPQQLYANLERSQVALWVSTPSFAELCVLSKQFGRAMMPKLEKMLFCGETLTHKLVDLLWQRFPGVEIINTYGPTEATVLVSEVSITPEMQQSELPLPIGLPLQEVMFRIVDEQGNSLPEGKTGELQIISNNVSRGYYKSPALTKKSFFETLVDGCMKRGYRTGDVVYCLNGLYYFCGRLDFQIKLNGFRIEPEDIENNLAKLKNVLKAIVMPVFDGERADHLVAFVLLKHKSELSGLKLNIEIKRQLKQFMPSYMIPKEIVVMDSFPVNTNGKIDRKALLRELDRKK